MVHVLHCHSAGKAAVGLKFDEGPPEGDFACLDVVVEYVGPVRKGVGGAHPSPIAGKEPMPFDMPTYSTTGVMEP